jgi:hypothetical protein
MAPFGKGVFDDGHYRIVSFRVENIAGADKDLYLIGLGPRLIETLVQITHVKRDEVDNTPPGNPYPLPFQYFKRRARVFRHDLTLQDRHEMFLRSFHSTASSAGANWSHGILE